MNRKSFCVGVLFGLILGASTVMLANALRGRERFGGTMPHTVTLPVSPVAVQKSPTIIVAGPEGTSISPGWQKRWFNGEPYYFIPLEHRVPG
jgi:hypothetical protein